jgi:shikimate dehydrogenase
MTFSLNGATRIYPVVGDPIAQVRAPDGVTRAFAERGVDAVCIPMQVAPSDFPVFMQTMRRTKNVDGIIVTVPHKIAAFDLCDRVSERAQFLRSVNTIIRHTDGTFSGDMFDGLAQVAACQTNGCDFKGRKALLVGTGGAGTAIAHAVASAGVASLGLADIDHVRRDDLVQRLRSAGFPVHAADANPTGYEIAINATPLGMRAGDPLPFPVDALTAATFVGDVVTIPEITPLIQAARASGCRTSTGTAMFLEVRDLLVDYLLSPAGRSPAQRSDRS